MYFFALSHAPPVLAAEIAIWTPETIAPGRNPAKMPGPNKNPSARGENITSIPGAIIYLRDALVEITMQAL